MPHSSHYGSLLIIVRMKVVQEGEADFLIKNVSTLKYGLHFSTVISRRDPLAGGDIEVLKKMHIRKQNEKYLAKDRFIYLMRYSTLAQACLKAKCWYGA